MQGRAFSTIFSVQKRPCYFFRLKLEPETQNYAVYCTKMYPGLDYIRSKTTLCRVLVIYRYPPRPLSVYVRSFIH